MLSVRSATVPVLVALTLATSACTGGTPTGDVGSTASSTASVLESTPGPVASATTTAPTDAAGPAQDGPTTPAPPAGQEPPSPADGGSPVLVSATLIDGTVEMTGYVDGLLVDGGTCRFELVAGGGVVVATSTSLADASVTLCPGVTVPAPAGPIASWRARLVWVPTGATSAESTVARG